MFLPIIELSVRCANCDESRQFFLRTATKYSNETYLECIRCSSINKIVKLTDVSVSELEGCE